MQLILKILNVGKLIPNLHDNTECVIHIKSLKQALNQFNKFLNMFIESLSLGT